MDIGMRVVFRRLVGSGLTPLQRSKNDGSLRVISSSAGNLDLIKGRKSEKKVGVAPRESSDKNPIPAPKLVTIGGHASLNIWFPPP